MTNEFVGMSDEEFADYVSGGGWMVRSDPVHVYIKAELLRRLGAAVSAAPQPRWVKQEDQNGCVVAAIAMIVGKSYAEVKSELRPKDLSTDAYTSFEAESYFYEHGYSIVKRWKHVCFAGTDREVWPAKPFAPVHYVQVVSGPSGKGHAVVMLANGDVLDPWAGSKPTKLSDYYQVNEIMGVFFAPAPAQEQAKQSVCKHCQQSIRCTKRFASDWEDEYGVFCSALSGLRYHEPVAEPASTGEQPRGITDLYEEGDENPNNVHFTYPARPSGTPQVEEVIRQHWKKRLLYNMPDLKPHEVEKLMDDASEDIQSWIELLAHLVGAPAQPGPEEKR